MASPPGEHSDLLAIPLLCVSAPGEPEQLPGESQQLPMDAEEICAIFSPAEEHSVNDQHKEQSDEDEVASMEVTHSQSSSYAAWYKQYENSCHGPEAVPPMVKIPYRMLLDVLLETLGLPPAEYRTRSFDHSMSEDCAAMETIGYIRCTVKIEIRDYNYSTMKKLKEENRSLKHELNIAKYNKKKAKTKIRSIQNKLMIATYEKKQNAMGWFVLTRYMHGFSDNISNVTTLNLSSGKGPIDKIINGPLINIEKMAQRLKRMVIKSEKKLRAIRMGF